MYATASGGGVVPPVLLEESRLPAAYHQAIVCCGAPSSSHLPNTALVYALMLRSGLPRQMLGQIWAMVNRTLPGQLTRAEFFSCLALIALAQVSLSSVLLEVVQRGLPLHALATVNVLPVPTLDFSSTHPIEKQNSALSDPTVGFLGVGGPMVRIQSPSPSQSKLATIRTLESAIDPRPSTKPDDPFACLTFDSFTLQTNGKAQQRQSSNAPPEGSTTPSIFECVTSSRSQASGINGHAALVNGDLSDVIKPTKTDAMEKEDNWKIRQEIWLRILSEVDILLNESNKFFSCNEASDIASTEMGTRYLRSLSKVIAIVQRIRHSSISSREVGDERQLREKIDDLLLKWRSIIARLMVDDVDHDDQLLDNEEDGKGQKCAICLGTVSDPGRQISFSGHFYHPECANFWVNRVESLLPSLVSTFSS